MSFKDLFENEGIEPFIVIQLKDKIDEKVFNDILIKEGLTKISIEMKNSEKSNVYNYFKFTDEINLSNITPVKFIGLDAENSCIYINSIKDKSKSSNLNLDDFFGINLTDFILGMKKILFKEKILDEVYDKAEEYKNHLEKYEANTDNIIEKIECRENIEPYNLFIIKHFIKYVIDKYKEENISSEDNSANENNEDNKNITTNPFITNGE